MNSKKGSVQQLLKRVTQTLSKVSSPKLTGSRVKLRDGETYLASKPINNNNNNNEV